MGSLGTRQRRFCLGAFAVAAAALLVAVACVFPARVHAAPASSSSASAPVGSVAIYRLFNYVSGEHLITRNAKECTQLVELTRQGKATWNYEGVGFYAPAKSAYPVYRLFDARNGGHLLTMSKAKRNKYLQLSKQGKMSWKDEGIAFYSAAKTGKPVYQMFNPRSSYFAQFHYTIDPNEAKTLVTKNQWVNEGAAWYAVGTPKKLAGMGITTKLPAARITTQESFALLADTHVREQGDDAGCFNNWDAYRAFRWCRTVPSLRAVVVAGDITDRGLGRSYWSYNNLWDAAGLSVPRIQCIGNHDTNEVGAWTPGINVKRCAEDFKNIVNGGYMNTFHSYKYANVMTVGGAKLSRDASTVFTAGMLKQLDANLKKTARQGKMAIVVCHYQYNSGYKNAGQLVRVLESYPNVIYVSGHKHQYSNKKQFQTVSMRYGANPYKRGGINVDKTRYSFKSVGLNSVTTFHGEGDQPWSSIGRDTFVSWLKINNTGRVTYTRRNLDTGQTKVWTMFQPKSSVTIKPVSSSKRALRGSFTYKVTFSDGKGHGGIANGARITILGGKARRISNIPAGVLVTVESVKSPAGWRNASRVGIEVSKVNRNITMKHSYTRTKATQKTAQKATQSTATLRAAKSVGSQVGRQVSEV